jgi:hypothetical protein
MRVAQIDWRPAARKGSVTSGGGDHLRRTNADNIASSKPRLRPTKSHARPHRLRSLLGAPALLASRFGHSASPVGNGFSLTRPLEFRPFRRRAARVKCGL